MSPWSAITVTVFFIDSYVFESKDGNRKWQTHIFD